MKEILRVLAADITEGIPCDQIPGCVPDDKGVVSGAGGVVVTDILTVVFWGLGVVGVIILVYGGILFMLSQGDAGKAQKARMTIIYAVVGIIVVLAAAAITNFVLGVL